MMKKKITLGLALILAGCICVSAQNDSSKNKLYAFQNTSLSFEERAADLVSHLTLTEKLALMQNDAKPVERLGIPSY